uniref:Uncharacterized protein n=1 Tax=Siphoviridae sp. ctkzC12 TaxID=2826446 RepID=A0A8S5LW40_9CAUD|nr:MAG TPA: hypothetical protein [Siphoviridae sp. ctkzC12]
MKVHIIGSPILLKVSVFLFVNGVVVHINLNISVSKLKSHSALSSSYFCCLKIN